MITNAPGKWEYKAILLPSAKENVADTARLKELSEELTKASAEYWEPVDLSRHMPGGYVMLRRSLSAPSTVKKNLFGITPKVAAPAVATAAKVITPAAARASVAANVAAAVLTK